MRRAFSLSVSRFRRADDAVAQQFAGREQEIEQHDEDEEGGALLARHFHRLLGDAGFADDHGFGPAGAAAREIAYLLAGAAHCLHGFGDVVRALLDFLQRGGNALRPFGGGFREHVDAAAQRAHEGRDDDRGGNRIRQEAEGRRAHQRHEDEAADHRRRHRRHEVLREIGRVQNGEDRENAEGRFRAHHAGVRAVRAAAFAVRFAHEMRLPASAGPESLPPLLNG